MVNTSTLRNVFVITAILASQASADVRIDREQQGLPKILDRAGKAVSKAIGFRNYLIPDTFGYKALEKQKRKNNDQFLRSNTQNQQNKRNQAREQGFDMLPCRREDLDEPPVKWQRGYKIPVPLKWNNPHWSSCEINAMTIDMLKVAPMARPTPCGGGYQDGRIFFTVPDNLEGCDEASGGCIAQFFAQSVETRTYVICARFVLEDGADAVGENPTGTLPIGVWKKATLYNDVYDIAHKDSQYGPYYGHQYEFLPQPIKDALFLRQHIGNGGLVPTKGPKDTTQRTRNRLNKKIQKEIKRNESEAKKIARQEQRKLDKGRRLRSRRDLKEGSAHCFQGELFSIVNNPKCKRQYTNTYVVSPKFGNDGTDTDIIYGPIAAEYAPIFEEEGIEPYAAEVKSTIETPTDNMGQYLKQGKASKEKADQKSSKLYEDKVALRDTAHPNAEGESELLNKDLALSGTMAGGVNGDVKTLRDISSEDELSTEYVADIATKITKEAASETV